MKREPNPVWEREMQQAARLPRTPWLLAGLTSVAGLAVCAVGGAAGGSSSPAEVGAVLFHTFFSIAFAIVTWLGPGVAALTIVSERTSRTWESVVLTGLSPRRVATGKLLAALTYIGLYLVALAPVGALPFLFGGITPTEVFAAFVLLGVFAVLAVSFGLAVSSGAQTTAAALLITLPLAVGISLATYLGWGVGGSFLAHEVWPGVEGGPPVWLPTAYVRADFGTRYVLYLFGLPVALAVIIGSFFFELSVANLSDASDDRSSGLKKWFAAASLAVTLLSAAPPLLVSSDGWALTTSALTLSALLDLMVLFVLSGDPPWPSRRVQAAWERKGAGRLERFLGPGIGRTAAALFAVTAATQACIAIPGILMERASGGSTHGELCVMLSAGYTVAFVGFLCGFAVFVGSNPAPRVKTRTALGLAVFVAWFVPLFAIAIAGLTSDSGKIHWLAAPSPLYTLFVMADSSVRFGGTGEAKIVASLAMAGWLGAGALLAVAGNRRLRLRSDAPATPAAVVAAAPEPPRGAPA